MNHLGTSWLWQSKFTTEVFGSRPIRACLPRLESISRLAAVTLPGVERASKPRLISIPKRSAREVREKPPST
jgi:hypothetical protein